MNALVEATEKSISKFPGFISANFHTSLDGTKVVNYAQWESEEALQHMMQDETAKVYMGKAIKVANKLEPVLTKVEYVNHR